MLCGAFIFALCYSAHAHAEVPMPTCEHRGEYHAKQHGMSREADSRWHVEHGERPTCGLDQHHDDHHEGGDEDHHIPHRDKPGFGCKFLRGCG